LSHEGEILNQKKEALREKSQFKECPFQPEIGDFNRMLAEKGETMQEFLDRMTTSKLATEQEIEMKRQEQLLKEMTYEANGKILGKIYNQFLNNFLLEMFHPWTNDYENNENLDRKLQGYKSVFDALYQESRILKEKKENLKKKTEQQNELLMNQYREFHRCEKTEKILFNMQKKKLASLFEQLDHDYDGYISAHKINISKLSNELLDVLTPLLLKIEEHQLELDFDQFFQIVMEFAKFLPLTDKEILLGAERELFKSPPEEYTFVPQLTANTKEIMKHSQAERRKINLWEDHRMRETGDKENKEMYECTFHPQTLDYNPKKFKKEISSSMGLKETLIHTMSNS
jgi:hypothetical protein